VTDEGKRTWTVYFNGSRLSDHDFELEVDSAFIRVLIRDQGLRVGSQLTMIVDSERLVVHAHGHTSTLHIMARSLEDDDDADVVVSRCVMDGHVRALIKRTLT
jgi:hypothetical protein